MGNFISNMITLSAQIHLITWIRLTIIAWSLSRVSVVSYPPLLWIGVSRYLNCNVSPILSFYIGLYVRGIGWTASCIDRWATNRLDARHTPCPTSPPPVRLPNQCRDHCIGPRPSRRALLQLPESTPGPHSCSCRLHIRIKRVDKAN